MLEYLRIVNIASTLPAAPNRWPIDDLVELILIFLLPLINAHYCA